MQKPFAIPASHLRPLRTGRSLAGRPALQSSSASAIPLTNSNTARSFGKSKSVLTELLSAWSLSALDDQSGFSVPRISMQRLVVLLGVPRKGTRVSVLPPFSLLDKYSGHRRVN